MATSLLFAAAIFAMVAYLWLLLRQAQTAPPIWLKATPILLLMMATLSATTPVYGVAVALFFSALGDLILEWRAWKPHFLVGLSAFLLAHLAYLAAGLPFVGGWDGRAALLFAFILLCALGMAYTLLRGDLGAMRWPVLLYLVVIGGMVTVLVLGHPFSWVRVMGGVLFMLSDSLIALDRFVRPIPHRNLSVMTTYYLAQLLLAWGFLAEMFA